MCLFSKSNALGAIKDAGRVLGTVACVVAGVIIVVPVGAGAVVAWAAGVIFDALRPKRTGVTGVRPE